MKGWRTIILNLAAGAPLIADVLLGLPGETAILVDLIPDEWLPYYSVVVIVANIYLRTITTTPMGRRE